VIKGKYWVYLADVVDRLKMLGWTRTSSEEKVSCVYKIAGGRIQRRADTN